MTSVNELCGLISVNKPAGMSSRDVVNRVERAARGWAKQLAEAEQAAELATEHPGLQRSKKIKVGHAGTLDPIASGVLVLCIGTATRLIEYVQRMPKAYRGTFLLGQSSESDDVESELVPLANAPELTLEELEQAAAKFVGNVEQRPPAFSAVKIEGQRAYKLARRGKQVDMPLRTVRIDSLEIVEYEYPRLVFDTRCGSGTYIRSLGRDLAESLGSAAVMSELVRTGIGPFQVEEASELDAIWPETLAEHLQPPLLALAGLPQVTLDAAEVEEIKNGRRVEIDESQISANANQEIVAVDAGGRLAAILVPRESGLFGPKCNFLR